MKRFFSIQFSDKALNIAILLLRIVFGVLIMTHGYKKIVHFDELLVGMPNLLGTGQKTALFFSIFAEFFCGAFVVLGLFTRIACVFLIVTLCVAVFVVYHSDFTGKGEVATLLLAAFVVLFFLGPGKLSVDGFINKKLTIS
jgi:putative oxidoreductase